MRDPRSYFGSLGIRVFHYPVNVAGRVVLYPVECKRVFTKGDTSASELQWSGGATMKNRRCLE